MMSRKIWEPGGMGYMFTVAKYGKCNPLPPDVAGVEEVWEGGMFTGGGRKRVHVTWAEIMRRRRERQAEELERKRCEGDIIRKRAVKVEVMFNSHWIYHGWHTYLHLIGEESEWISRHRNETPPLNLATLFPLINPKYPLFGPVTKYDEWMPLFAKTYQSGKICGKPRGVRLCWAMASKSRGVHELFL